MQPTQGYILVERRVSKGVECTGMHAALRDASKDARKFGEARDLVHLAYRQIALKLNVRLLSMMPPRVPRMAIATHSFEGSALNDLRFKYGDRITLTPPFDKVREVLGFFLCFFFFFFSFWLCLCRESLVSSFAPPRTDPFAAFAF
jgi:hypothetical protein